jgi:uncharacterized membrane protein YfcA
MTCVSADWRHADTVLPVTVLEMLAVAGAGGVAGAVNTIVGSGSLITFPTLLAVGFPPVTANVSNTVGLVFGSISGAWGYRRELRGQGRRTLTLGAGSAAGALAGGILLLSLPSSVFGAVVPLLILLAVALMAFKPTPRGEHEPLRAHLAPATGGTFLTGIYGGYFGAAQGVILLAVLRLAFGDDLQRLNAIKNVLAGIANGAAAVLFIAVAHIAWDAAALLAGGSILGGFVGSAYGRRLPEAWLRRIVIVGGTIVAVILLVD